MGGRLGIQDEVTGRDSEGQATRANPVEAPQRRGRAGERVRGGKRQKRGHGATRRGSCGPCHASRGLWAPSGP